MLRSEVYLDEKFMAALRTFFTSPTTDSLYNLVTVADIPSRCTLSHRFWWVKCKTCEVKDLCNVVYPLVRREKPTIAKAHLVVLEFLSSERV